MNEAVGDYIPLLWDGTPDYGLVRGHVSHEDAALVLGRELGWAPDEFKSEHGYARRVPTERGSDYDFRVLLCPRGRGAFAVTICEWTGKAPHA